MAYARFSDADVYVFMSTSGHLECCGCRLGDPRRFDSTQAMVDHLAKHREAGHDVPDGLEAGLWADDRENWVDYQRCAVDGCDKRVTCGSPAPGGYVSCCSIEHAQTLGGFSDFPPAKGY
ncbi:MAG: hypothetical protein QM628_00430 [Propionicimonas sp.]